MPFTEDPGVFLADWGVPCVFGASSFLAILDQPDSATLMEPAHVMSREYELRYITAQAVLARQQVGTVDGVVFKVREAPRQYADGIFSTVTVTKV